MAKDSFNDFNLHKDILKGLYVYGFIEPSDIQTKGITAICSKKDCLIQSQSGTGKTATYLLSIFNNIIDKKNLAAIIIVPTRELAEQVYKVATSLSQFTTISINMCIGGIRQEYNKLKTSNLIIGTIGRLYHMIELKKISLNNLSMIIIDEADNLINYQMDDKLKYILTNSPEDVQLVLISATINAPIFDIIKEIMVEPIKILLKKSDIPVELIDQFYIDVGDEINKYDVLIDLYNIISTTQVIIFCNTIKKIEYLKQNLENNNFAISCIHSNNTYDERMNTINDFRQGKTRILLTSDLLSRGIDIPEVNLVICYDIPNDLDTYIHRIGRTGRYKKKGCSITLISNSNKNEMKIFDKLTSIYKIKIKPMPNDIQNYI